MKDLLALGRHGLAAVRVMILLTLVLGLAYPLVLTGIAQLAVPWRANGSLVTVDGGRTTDPSQVIGPDRPESTAPGLFVGRPSVHGNDMLATGGSNLGPESEEPAGRHRGTARGGRRPRGRRGRRRTPRCLDRVGVRPSTRTSAPRTPPSRSPRRA
ncbi:MAG: potassium-transporting ATPase subunit C [Nocardioidaceae bacterium]